ncbi:hypothetical protein [Oceanicaulis sp. MMSF_3324]|uniref:hypothetical protein n=1 Tax=Oceanicaulis sp. MMSF_3324 TaxID=3046702 RepID=UPI00273D2A4C|nr:hypothetical protein [Oceanicaulis sp. MMSF_3324]
MHVFAKLAAAAAFAGLAATALPANAQASDLTISVSASTATPQSQGYRRGYEPHHRGHRWNGPEGHFVVYARACPDLREDRRDRRRNTGWRDRREDRRDRRVIDCPDRAWDYIPSRRELRAGRTGERLRPDRAYLDRRTGGYYVETRWGAVPVQVVHGRRWHDRHGRGHGRGHRRDHYGYGRH